MDLTKVLRDEEIRSHSSAFIRELVDITRANNITDAMLDTPNRKMEYSDLVIEFQKSGHDFFRVKKSRFCDVGLYGSQKYHTTKIGEWRNKESELETKIEALNSEVSRLNSELEKKNDKKGSKKDILSGKFFKKVFGI